MKKTGKKNTRTYLEEIFRWKFSEDGILCWQPKETIENIKQKTIVDVYWDITLENEEKGDTVNR